MSCQCNRTPEESYQEIFEHQKKILIDASDRHIIEMMKDKNRAANQVLADMMFFDYLKEKVGERKTKTGAYYDLL